MAQFYYDPTLKIYRKQCSCCKEIFEGTSDIDESIAIFSKDFAIANGSAQMADSFQSRCRFCNSHGRRLLGITKKILQAMFDAQEGKCAICHIALSIEQGTNTAHVDHNDETGEIRELLCGPCNQGIGLLKHQPERLEAAAKYIRKHAKVVPIRRNIV